MEGIRTLSRAVSLTHRKGKMVNYFEQVNIWTFAYNKKNQVQWSRNEKVTVCSVNVKQSLDKFSPILLCMCTEKEIKNHINQSGTADCFPFQIIANTKNSRNRLSLKAQGLMKRICEKERSKTNLTLLSL
jgi:hypothetical protein